jgi:hypothetical protein
MNSMKYIRAIPFVLAVGLVTTLPVLAQSPSPDAAPALNLDPQPAPSLNRFSLNYRMGFNAPLSFKHLGGYPPLSNARTTLDGDPYNYDNGYVIPISGSPSPYTYYWGYDSASQVSGNTITMQRSSSPASASSNDHYDSPTPGFELAYNRELIRKTSWRGGLEGAFGYTYMSIRDAGTQPVNVTRVNDTFTVPGGVPAIPPAPYQGRLALPGPLIGASPTSSMTEILQDGSLTGSRSFSADLFCFRLGPYFEIPLSKSISFTLGGGFALMYVNSELSYNETVTVPGAGNPLPHQASGSATGLLPGGYVEGVFSVALSDAWAFVAGAQLESVGQYTQTLNGEQAVLDLSKAIFVTLGLSYSF